ncbi:MAG: hypothetical protein SGJ01_04065 [Gemmatimonadota bacterium]|nr:hypothetical protein [Gemmatimonadota bacterium]
MRPLAVLLLFAALLPPPPLPAQEAIDAGIPASATAAIRIWSLTGSIRLTTWARDSVSVRGRVDASAGHFFLGGTREALKFGVESAAGVSPGGTADLEIRVPAGARLWITSAAAELDLTLDGGSATIVTVGSRVRVAGRAHDVSVETLDGNVELAFDGDEARVRTASGTVVVRGIIQQLDAATVSAALLIGMEGKVRSVQLQTTSGEIAFKGDLVPDGVLHAETHGGEIELRMPPHLGARWHLVSFGAGIVNQLVRADAVKAGPAKGEWHFTTGDGRATVDVRTFKGSVSLIPRFEP